MTLSITRYDTPLGTPAATLWAGGMRHLMAAVPTPPRPILDPAADLMAWVATTDGEPAGASFRPVFVAEQDAEGIMTFVRPEHRGKRIHAEIQRRMDADLLAMGITHIRSSVIDDPLPSRMIPAIQRRGGTVAGEDIVESAAAAVRGRAARHQQHRLHAGLPCLVQQQRAGHGEERQRLDSGPRRGAAGGAGDQATDIVSTAAESAIVR
jgi:hypothetical protein